MPRVRQLGPASVFFAALCAVMASRAYASGPVTLRWSAPVDCPTNVEVLEEVNRLLGARTVPDERVFDVAADVTRKDDGTYVVRLEIPATDGPRLREVSAVSCAALGQATALILAMMVDPEAALTAPASPPETPPGQTLPKVEASVTSTSLPLAFDRVSRPPPSKSFPSQLPVKKSLEGRRLPFSAALHLRGDLGSLPDPAMGLGGAFGIFPGRLRFEFGAAYFLNPFSPLSKYGANVNSWIFHATGGAAIAVRPKLEMTPRIRFEVGRMAASSFGVSDMGEGAGITVGLGVGGLASLQVTRNVHVGLGLDILALLAYPRFIVTGIGVVHEPSMFVVHPTIEAAWRF